MSEYIERYWRDATPEDAIREPPMVARFRDEHYKEWVIDKLIYWDRSETPWNRDDGYCYERCQVYDAPDPGEGWRLVDPNQERLRIGDEFSFYSGSQLGWLLVVDSVQTNWSQKNFYRRRIEQPKPKYVPFEWQDREQLRGRWLQRKTDSIPTEQIATKFETGRRGLIVNGIYGADLLLKQWTFLDTGEPVGRRVE